MFTKELVAMSMLLAATGRELHHEFPNKDLPFMMDPHHIHRTCPKNLVEYARDNSGYCSNLMGQVLCRDQSTQAGQHMCWHKMVEHLLWTAKIGVMSKTNHQSNSSDETKLSMSNLLNKITLLMRHFYGSSYLPLAYPPHETAFDLIYQANQELKKDGDFSIIEEARELSAGNCMSRTLPFIFPELEENTQPDSLP